MWEGVCYLQEAREQQQCRLFKIWGRSQKKMTFAGKLRMLRDNSDLQQLIRIIEDSGNPFGGEMTDAPYNIGTGKAASQNVQTFLVNCQQNGEE